MSALLEVPGVIPGGPPGPGDAGPPGIPDPPAAFASVLSNQVARTALAEGQTPTAPATRSAVGSTSARRPSPGPASGQTEPKATTAGASPSGDDGALALVAAVSAAAGQALAPAATSSSPPAATGGSRPSAPASSSAPAAAPSTSRPAARPSSLPAAHSTSLPALPATTGGPAAADRLPTGLAEAGAGEPDPAAPTSADDRPTPGPAPVALTASDATLPASALAVAATASPAAVTTASPGAAAITTAAPAAAAVTAASPAAAQSTPPAGSGAAPALTPAPATAPAAAPVPSAAPAEPASSSPTGSPAAGSGVANAPDTSITTAPSANPAPPRLAADALGQGAPAAHASPAHAVADAPPQAPPVASASQDLTATGASPALAVAAPSTVTNHPAVTAAGAAANARYGVGLAQAAEKVSEMIALSARNGVSQARISLTPATLGTINIHLQRTPDGIIARVVTEHPEAAAALASGGEDLRRQLAQQGTQLLRLDIETSDRRSSQDDADPNGGSSAGDRHTGDDDPVPAVSTETELPPLSSGSLTASSLINVLA